MNGAGQGRWRTPARTSPAFWTLCFLSGLLLYGAPQFVRYPWHVTAFVVMLAGLQFFFLLRSRSDDPRAVSVGSGAGGGGRRVLVFLPAFLPLFWIPSGFYFSDDALRHVQDGIHILKGVDVYAVPAGQLANPLGLTPNQPQLGSIYLPTIQFISVMGAVLNGAWGFRILFALVSVGLAFLILYHLTGRRRDAFGTFLLSPLLVVVSASRHSDVIGALCILSAMMLMRKRSAGGLFLGGFLSVMAAGAKPEGIVFGAALFASLLIGARSFRSSFWFIAGALPACLGLGVFSRVYLFPTAASLAGFRGALDFYVRELLAYHPIGLLRHAWGWSVEAVNVRIREEGAGVLIGLLAGLPGLWIATRPYRTMKTIRRLARSLVRPMLLGILIGMFAMRPVWHPWHFLWVLLALAWVRQFRLAFLAAPILFLMYTAVPVYRAGGPWSDGLFWLFSAVFGAAGAFWFWLTKCRRWFLSY